MDITPLAGWFAFPTNPIITALLIIVLIDLAVYTVMAFKLSHLRKGMGFAFIGISVALCLLAFSHASISQFHEKKQEVQGYVTGLGFDITDGTVAVYAGDDETMTVTQNGENHSCTSYAPEDQGAHIFFVCDSTTGEGRSSLPDLKLQLDKAAERAEADSAATTNQ